MLFTVLSMVFTNFCVCSGPAWLKAGDAARATRPAARRIFFSFIWTSVRIAPWGRSPSRLPGAAARPDGKQGDEATPGGRRTSRRHARRLLPARPDRVEAALRSDVERAIGDG